MTRNDTYVALAANLPSTVRTSLDELAGVPFQDGVRVVPDALTDHEGVVT
jgi:hypothetical protein